ncbi:hypothetical protein, partial [Stenotrophomonas maltophilia]|uniref:hypothetical protein n=1 Tax=Stenotrophomonas maltophilia TaxID=40324 RepID=UPI001E535981
MHPRLSNRGGLAEDSDAAAWAGTRTVLCSAIEMFMEMEIPSTCGAQHYHWPDADSWQPAMTPVAVQQYNSLLPRP